MTDFHDTFGRLYGLALIDILGTLFFIPVVLYILKLKYTFLNILGAIVFLFIFAEMAHVAFHIKTPISKFIIKG